MEDHKDKDKDNISREIANIQGFLNSLVRWTKLFWIDVVL